MEDRDGWPGQSTRIDAQSSYEDVSLLDFPVQANRLSWGTTTQARSVSARSLSPLDGSFSQHLPPAQKPDANTKSRVASIDSGGNYGSMQSRKRSRVRRNPFLGVGWWWWELGSILLAIVCTVLTMSVLLYMDGRRLTDWKLKISPNTVVSALSTLSKSALLYPVAECLGQLKWMYFEKPRPLDRIQALDAASRGPWGATVSLWKAGSTAKLASVGAIVTIVMLAFEPFTQQVIGVTSRNAPIEGEEGFVTRSVAWPDVFFDEERFKDFTLEYSYYPLLTSILGAAADQPIHLTSNSFCPSSQCRFSEYDSLAVCATCEETHLQNDDFDECTYDIEFESDEAITRNNFTSFKEAMGNASEYRFSKVDIYCSKHFGDFPSLSIAVSIYTSDNPDEGKTDAYLYHVEAGSHVKQARKGGEQTGGTRPNRYVESCNNLNSSRPVDLYPNNEEALRSPTPISYYTCMNSSTNLFLYDDITHLGEINVTASQCSLSYCAKRYQSAIIQNGALTFGNIIDIPLKRENESHAYNPETFGDPFDEVLIATDPAISTRYTIGQHTRLSLKARIATFTNTTDFQYNLYFYQNRDAVPGNWTNRFHKIADSMSLIIQNSRNPNTTKIAAEVFSEQVFVRVRWAWFVLPLSVVLTSILFLFVTIFQSRTKPYLFKTSIIAVLFHGLEGWDISAVQVESNKRRVTYDELMEKSGTMTVRFRENEEGSWKLKKE